MTNSSEHAAWLWLLGLPRIQIPTSATGRRFRELNDRQIKISLCPGKLRSTCGAPLLRISALIPGCKKRVIGSGNSLAAACERLRHEAWLDGVQLPSLHEFDLRTP